MVATATVATGLLPCSSRATNNHSDPNGSRVEAQKLMKKSDQSPYVVRNSDMVGIITEPLLKTNG
jgi:hypothetical protein